MMGGRYDYWRDGQPTDIYETWHIESLASGMHLITTGRIAKTYGSQIQVIAHRNEIGHIIACHIAWEHAQTPRISADYELSDVLRVRRQFGTQRENGMVYLEETAYLAPLLRIFMGITIQNIVANGGSALIIVPNIINSTDTHQLLTPTFERRQARFISSDRVAVGETTIAANCYRYLGAQYDESAQFWVDDAGILIRYTWNEWDIRLTAYQR